MVSKSMRKVIHWYLRHPEELSRIFSQALQSQGQHRKQIAGEHWLHRHGFSRSHCHPSLDWHQDAFADSVELPERD